MNSPRKQLAINAIVQVLAMSLWFSASAVVPALHEEWGISRLEGGLLTASVQVGFVIGAIGLVLGNLPDRLPPQVMIGASAAIGALSTLAFALLADGLAVGLPLRVVTGAALAGVYPSGLRLMASWFSASPSLAVAVLVAALTVGSGAPQLLTGLPELSWRAVLTVAAGLALLGAAIAIRYVRAGPGGSTSPPFEPAYVATMLRDRSQRLINLGYLGHMWELYALWTWLPAFVAASYAAWSEGAAGASAVGVTSFLVIAVAGATGCIAGGALATRRGPAPVATGAMCLSAVCCLAAPLVFGRHPAILLSVLLIWGAVVIADSAQFSVALSRVADPRYVGTALTAQTAMGFCLTVVSIQLLPVVAHEMGWRVAIAMLAIGPLLGAVAMNRVPVQHGNEKGERCHDCMA